MAPAVFLAGCGGNQEAEGNSSAQNAVTNDLGKAVSEVIEARETTQAAATKGAVTDSPNYRQNLNILRCQIKQATAGMSQQQANDYSNQALQEAMSKGTNMQAILAERGYDCGWSLTTG